MAIENSDDGERRTFWLKIVRPAITTHPFPLNQKTQNPEMFRRDIRDLVLLMRKKELNIDLTKDTSEEDTIEDLGDEPNEDPDVFEDAIDGVLDDKFDIENSEEDSLEKGKVGVRFVKNKSVRGSTFVDQALQDENVDERVDVD